MIYIYGRDTDRDDVFPKHLFRSIFESLVGPRTRLMTCSQPIFFKLNKHTIYILFYKTPTHPRSTMATGAYDPLLPSTPAPHPHPHPFILEAPASLPALADLISSQGVAAHAPLLIDAALEAQTPKEAARGLLFRGSAAERRVFEMFHAGGALAARKKGQDAEGPLARAPMIARLAPLAL